MEKRLQAVYTDGVLQPLEAVTLEDEQQVTVTITDPAAVGQDVTGYFSPEEWAEAAHDEADIARHRILVAPPVHESHFHSARRLLIQYGVSEGRRTLDALQLAIALDLRQRGQADVLVAADQRLCRVASMAGCSAANPENRAPCWPDSVFALHGY